MASEFKGFPKFWKEARKFWSLAEAVRIYHMSSDPWLQLRYRQGHEEWKRKRKLGGLFGLGRRR